MIYILVFGVFWIYRWKSYRISTHNHFVYFSSAFKRSLIIVKITTQFNSYISRICQSDIIIGTQVIIFQINVVIKVISVIYLHHTIILIYGTRYIITSYTPSTAYI